MPKTTPGGAKVGAPRPNKFMAPPTVKCRRFLHFRNLKHRNLSRLILRQSVTTLCGFHCSLMIFQAIGVHSPTRTCDFSIPWIGDFLAACIRLMVRLIGRRVTREEAPWLNCPMGTSKLIGADFYHQLAIDEQLKIADEPAGLLTDFSLLKGEGFDPTQVRQEIHEFYERTSEFRLEAWSEAPLFTRMFLWVLTRFVSRRMNQLNFPVSSLELAGGMTSDLLPMNNDSGQRVYTGWLRRLAKSGHVIYTGLYSVESPGEFADPCVKVSFPLPQGSATVFLRPEAQPDGSFKLMSSGRNWRAWFLPHG